MRVPGLVAVAWDGTTLAAEATAANVAAFGLTGSPFPQLRLVTLAACGTRGLLALLPSQLEMLSQRHASRSQAMRIFA